MSCAWILSLNEVLHLRRTAVDVCLVLQDNQKVAIKRKTELGGTLSIAAFILIIGLCLRSGPEAFVLKPEALLSDSMPLLSGHFQRACASKALHSRIFPYLPVPYATYPPSPAGMLTSMRSMLAIWLTSKTQAIQTVRTSSLEVRRGSEVRDFQNNIALNITAIGNMSCSQLDTTRRVSVQSRASPPLRFSASVLLAVCCSLFAPPSVLVW